MSSGDVNAIIRAFLAAQASLTAVVSTRIHCPRIPEKSALPALAFFGRGGDSNPHIPPIVTPSVQFDCWGSDPIQARQVYHTLYDILQGMENQSVVIAPNTYRILSAAEEVQPQDLQDVEYPGYFKVLAFFSIKVQISPV